MVATGLLCLTVYTSYIGVVDIKMQWRKNGRVLLFGMLNIGGVMSTVNMIRGIVIGESCSLITYILQLIHLDNVQVHTYTL